MNDFAQPKIGDNVTLNRTRLGQYVHLADDAILEEVEMGTTPTPPGTTRSLRHYRQVRLHCFLCAHQSQQPPDLPAHRAAPLHLSRFRIRAGEDDAAFFDWRREHHVTVGHDVWIGHNAILMPGVSVGNGAVIGSAAVVTRTWSLQHRRRRGGQKIGMRFDDALIERIERSQWWHWDHATLQARLADFRDINRFAQKYL